MSSVALDASILVAAILRIHDRHVPSRDALSAALAGNAVLPQAALVEAYAVLTRLPAPLRLRPHDAAATLEGTLKGGARVVALTPATTWKALEDWGRMGIAGGSVYDRRILAEAKAGGATRLLTLNPRDFDRFGAQGVEIVDPSAPASR